MLDLAKFLRLPPARSIPDDPVLQARPGDDRVTIFVTLFGANTARMAEILRHHRRRTRAVVVTTATDLRPLFTAGILAEHMPSPDMVAAFRQAGGEAADLAEYVRIRWQRLHRKWQPTWTVNYGTSFDQYLRDLDPRRSAAGDVTGAKD